jgi:formate hydrogenlyase transcriptional activator
MTVRLRAGERYATILEVNRAAITQPGLNEMFQGMCKAVKKVIPYDRAGLSLYAPEKDSLKLAALEGCSPDSFYNIGLVLDCKQSHHGWVFEHQKPIVRRDLQREFEFQIEQYNVKEGIRSYCAVPLIARGESIGVIIILSSQKNRYSEGHAEFLQEVSDQVVLAITSLLPFCSKHLRTKLICPRCIASGGGLATAAKYKEQLSDWGKQGGRGRKKPASGLTKDVLV